MIIQVNVENFKSISHEIVFSMLSSSDELHQSLVKKQNNYDILPSSLLIGANGAGKSNLFQSIKYLQDLLKSKSDQLEVYPHKLSDENKPTKIDIQFIKDERRYAYGVEVNKDEVMSEYLYVFEDDQIIEVFEREFETYTFLDEALRKYVPGNRRLFLNEHFNNEYINNAYSFLTHDLYIYINDLDLDYALYREARSQFKEPKNQKLVRNLIKKLNIGINDIIVSKDDEIILKYANMDINIEEESTGNRRLFALLTKITDVLNDGKVLCVDELDKNLHLLLVKYIIKLFNENKNDAQIIFSTHNTSLLDLDLFRRDQIWFMEKDLKTLQSDLYSLANVEDVDQNENIEKGYIVGKYGATYEIDLGDDIDGE